MILLDTNVLIGMLVPESVAAGAVARWVAAGSPLATSAVAWSEFLTGPVTPTQTALVREVLEGRIYPFGAATAARAAALFNAAGRRRELRVDALIAATASERGAALATADRDIFSVFVATGLRLAEL